MFLLLIILWSVLPSGRAWGRDEKPYQPDTTILPASKDTLHQDTLHYPLEDRRGDPFSVHYLNGFDLRDPSNIHDSIAYDPTIGRYYIYEKVGTTYYRMPTSYTFDELFKIVSDQSEMDYFRQRADALSALNRNVDNPDLVVHPGYFNRIFSTTGIPKIDIKPQGLIDVRVGYEGQKVDNPTLPEAARSNGGFDFGMNANVNVNAQVGDKMKLPIMYNTQSTFDFENQLKLEYSGTTDEILKKIDAGNINFTTKSTLIPSVQSLFGIKAQLQFGKLFVTAAIANQRAATQSVTLQGGAATQPFDLKGSAYDANRNFLLAQYFKNNFNKVMSTAPVMTSPINIVRMEVWVTNRQGATLNNRIVVGLADLGENQPYNTAIVHPQGNSNLPSNGSNTLYGTVTGNAAFRDITQVNSKLQSLGLQQVQDYEYVYARKLNTNEFYFNPQVGFICVNTTLQPNDVLAVAYQYTYNGQTYQVGEFSTDVTPDTSANAAGNQQTLFLKLLKATGARPNLPIWNLMMKNVYSIGSGTLQQSGFVMNVLYDQPGGGNKNYLPFGGGGTQGTPILSLVGLDKLNSSNEPQPDGQFDFLPNFTVLPQFSKIIFPVLQPFGRDLASAIYNPVPPTAGDTLFYALYDSIQHFAQNSPQFDRFEIKGTYKGTSSNQVSLGAFNIPPGSVTVTSGGTALKENVDYIVDYNLGQVKIVNQAILNSGVPVNVQFENNGTYGLQQRNFMGLRLDYQASKSLALGATFEKLSERPYYNKVQYGEDPINNTMIGVDMNYKSDFPRMTKWLNSLYTTTAPSNIQAHAEVAHLIPGHPSQIGKGTSGAVYIDDFEASSSGVDLRFPFTSWAAASTPYGAINTQTGNVMFPEAALNDNLDYGKNRARLAWYNIETTLQDPNSPSNPLKGNLNALSDPRVRPVSYQELFPQETTDIGQNQLVTFDLAYYPTARGQYNFDAASGDVDASGNLLNPQSRWGGIMRALDQTDFQSGNIQYIEFWIQDPFILNPTSSGGRLYFNLGNVSEDILKDGKHFFENGLSTPVNPAPQDTSLWGNVPRNPIQITNAFSNDPSERPYQDIGLDGMNDAQEQALRTPYLHQLGLVVSGAGLAAAQADPSSDDYVFYEDPSFSASTGILTRYKYFNNTEGNSPVVSSSATLSSAATLYPDNEDLNGDNNMNEDEEYFQYHVELLPPNSLTMQVGSNFITNRENVTTTYLNGKQATEVWYQFRIPVNSYETVVGSPDFSNIQFMRMFMTNFKDSAVLRFGELELVRNQWLAFDYKVDSTGLYDTVSNTSQTTFNVTAVNIEQDASRTPVPYVIPPGVQRQQILSTNNVTLLQNEQSMSLQIYNLQGGDSRAVYKTTNLDLRQYKTMQMFIHAEAAQGLPLANGQLTAVIRIGQDFVQNYYQITIPLQVTPAGANIDTVVWPTANNLDLTLQDLVQLKLHRKGPITTLYSEAQPGGVRYAVMGVPNIAQVSGVLFGIQNQPGGQPISTEIWVDELRLSGLNEKGGYAATGRVDAQLGDLGTFSADGSIKTVGWGNIDQTVMERALATTTQVDASTSLELGKLLPKKVAVSVPFYGGVSQTVSTPEYDPFDQDVQLKQEYGSNKAIKDSIKNYAVEKQTISTINFTNVRKIKKTGKKPKMLDISNVDVSFSFTESKHHSPTYVEDFSKKYYAGIGYSYSGPSHYWQPFKKFEAKKKSRWMDLIRDLNISTKPSQIIFREDVNRLFAAQEARSVLVPGEVDTTAYHIPETYNKYFTIAKTYGLNWDITKSITFNVQAIDSALVDEPDGRLNSKHKRDSLWSNFFKGGRNTMYKQTTTASYTVPLSKVPVLDWTNLTMGYIATYQWNAASQYQQALGLNLGSTLQNSSMRTAKVQFDMKRLYEKLKFFKQLDALDLAGMQKKAAAPTNQKQDTSAAARLRKSAPPPPVQPSVKGLVADPVAQFFARILTSIRTLGVSYSQNYSTFLPGFTDSAVSFGQDWKNRAPGLGFALGQQPTPYWLENAAAKGWLTRDTSFNQMLTQTYDEELQGNATLSPFRDLTIDVVMTKSFQKSYQALFKDTLGNGSFSTLSPYASGGFTVSYISFKTLFKPFNPNVTSQTFLNFESYGTTLSRRLSEVNPYSTGYFPVGGYYKGYGQYSQDVLVPAFIAAYTGQDPNKVALLGQQNKTIQTDPFSGYKPMPNWHMTYTGLTRIPAIADVFRSITLTNAYTGTLSMNGFGSNLTYSDPMGYGWPGFIDTVSHSFVPFFYVPNTTITEQFSPLIGVDMTTVSGMNIRFSYLKGRTVALSLVDYQVSDTRNSGFTIGGTWRKKGINLPFKVPFSGKDTHRLDNDMTFKLDFSLQNNSTSNSILGQNLTTPVAGNKTIKIDPSVDYVVNKRVNVRFYFDQTRVIPYISSSPPTSLTRMGLEFKVSLAP